MTIRQFDVVPNPVRSGREQKPFLLCVQHRNLVHLQTRVMASLLANSGGRENRLNPGFLIAGTRVFLDPTDLTTMLEKHLPPAIVSLDADRDRIVAALDLVFTGV